DVSFNGGGPVPALSPAGFIQFDSNPPITIAGPVKLNFGFLQDVRYVQIFFPQQSNPYSVNLTVSNAAEVVGV
ncbi:MAG: hypothetical protein NUW37_11810, partial [Planctomycetes bacterium]|nr:hypothetical protein [Planctomycetota bacterium]